MSVLRSWTLCMMVACHGGGGSSTDPPDGGTNPVTVSLEAGSSVEDCHAIAFDEAREICLLDLAVRAARKQNVDGAGEACVAIRDELWREECHFRIAEVLGLRIALEPALAHCDVSGEFARFCFIHAAWWARHFEIEARPTDSNAAAVVDAFVGALEPDPESVRARERPYGMALLRASAWFEVYYGAGIADPTAARAAQGINRVPARTAFAFEAVRLLGPHVGSSEVLRAVQEVWQGQRAPPTGSEMQPHCWWGRVTPVWTSPDLETMRRGYTPHGGERSTSEVPADDLAVATLEALFFHASTPADVWGKWLADPRAGVRVTAGRLGALARASGEPWEQHLAAAQDRTLQAAVRVAQQRTHHVWTARDDRSDCLPPHPEG